MPTCVSTDLPADLTMDIEALGAIFLGGHHLMTLHEADKVAVHQPASLPRADAMFAVIGDAVVFHPLLTPGGARRSEAPTLVGDDLPRSRCDHAGSAVGGGCDDGCPG